MKKYMIFFLVFPFFFTQTLFAQTFFERQASTARVKIAKKETDTQLKAHFQEIGLPYPPNNLFIRIFKEEYELELWMKNPKTQTYQLIRSYEVCSMSGEAGPKRREGDLQVPEGFYHIDYYNAYSSFFLSVKINYPNTSDRILGYKPSLGGNICIHGACASIGCVAITDPKIKEVYWMLIQAKKKGQRNIPVHIFPNKMTQANREKLEKAYADDEKRLKFWNNIKTGYQYFETHKKLPKISVDKTGSYLFN